MPDSVAAELRGLIERVLANQAELAARLDRYERALPVRFRLAVSSLPKLAERTLPGAAITHRT